MQEMCYSLLFVYKGSLYLLLVTKTQHLLLILHHKQTQFGLSKNHHKFKRNDKGNLINNLLMIKLTLFLFRPCKC